MQIIVRNVGVEECGTKCVVYKLIDQGKLDLTKKINEDNSEIQVLPTVNQESRVEVFREW